MKRNRPAEHATLRYTLAGFSAMRVSRDAALESAEGIRQNKKEEDGGGDNAISSSDTKLPVASSGSRKMSIRFFGYFAE